MNNNEKYIAYLNSLHNYNAQNANSFGEKNVGSEFYKEIAVKTSLGSFVEKQLRESDPYLLILTGHAGDGKTSTMYQVLDSLGIQFNAEEKISDVKLPNGRNCRCIKDFSEFNDDKKLDTLKECINLLNSGWFVFMVSNTGPLINTFGRLFDESDSEEARIDLINAMDKNSREVFEIKGIRLGVINMASIDNTSFAVKLVPMLIKDSLWNNCNECDKKEYCHILRNKQLIKKNEQRVLEFLEDHYVWLFEHGKRLTIRSMTEQLAYMITGGIECRNVYPLDQHLLLFFNLFFGYIGLEPNERALSINAVREARLCEYDKKRLRADEYYLVDRNYSDVFGEDLADILNKAYGKDGLRSGWAGFLRRAYMFANIEIDSVKKNNDSEDIFSKQFRKYMCIRNGSAKPSRTETKIITEALSMIYTGKVGAGNEIQITLSRTSGIMQNVQLVIGVIPVGRLSFIQYDSGVITIDDNEERYELRLKSDGVVIETKISLPMLNYFDELRHGVIATNIDPLLSHGVESLKAQLVKQYVRNDDDVIEIVVLKNNKDDSYKLEVTEHDKIQIV